MRASFHLHVIHERLIVCSLLLHRSVFLRVSLCLLPLLSLTLYLYSDLHSFFHVDSAKGNTCCAFAK